APGPIDPLPWVNAVADYTRRHVQPAKVVLGLPLYGQDWSGKGASPVTASTAPKIAAQHNVPAHLDATSSSMPFTYADKGVNHTVWYDGTDETQRRADIAPQYNFAGVSYWALGDEAANFWD